MTVPIVLTATVATYDYCGRDDFRYFILFGVAVFVLSVGEVFFEVAGKLPAVKQQKKLF